MICPKCGKEDVENFYDTKLKISGHHCLDCNTDFGVDDERLKKAISNLADFYYQRTYKDGKVEEIYIHKVLDKVTVLPTLILPSKVKQPYSEADISDMFSSFKDLIFKKLYILDWNLDSEGLFLKEGNESFTIRMKFDINALDEITIKGINAFPPYLKALDNLFKTFFGE